MAADIHLWIERYVENTWSFACPYSSRAEDGRVEFESPYHGRNYSLFAALADVRNGTGEAGYVEPVSIPRGLPYDVSDVGLRIAEQWADDGHSHSWLTANELLGLDWERPVEFTGFTSSEAAAQLEAGGPPPELWVLDACGRLTERVRFEVPLREVCPEFVEDFLPRLLNYGEATDVRVVFFFDN